jgi:hypothetical protein
MPTTDEVREALLDQIMKKAGEANAPNLLWLAEAFAWLMSPTQSHGGSTVPRS